MINRVQAAKLEKRLYHKDTNKHNIENLILILTNKKGD